MLHRSWSINTTVPCTGDSGDSGGLGIGRLHSLGIAMVSRIPGLNESDPLVSNGTGIVLSQDTVRTGIVLSQDTVRTGIVFSQDSDRDKALEQDNQD